MKTKWKRWLCLLCAAALILGVFSACGSSSETEPDSSEKEEASESASAEAEESEPEEEPEEAEEAAAEPDAEPEAPAEPADVEYQTITDETAAILADMVEKTGAVPSDQVDDADKNETWLFVESEEYQSEMKEVRAELDANLPTSEKQYDENGSILSVKGVTYDYPMEEERSISALVTVIGFVGRYIEDFSDFLSMQIAEAETNIHVEWTYLSEEQMKEQMNLMFASDDFTDIVTEFNLDYAGTASGAYGDDLIILLNDYLPEYAPNYWAWLNQDKETLKNALDDDGNILEFYVLDPAESMVTGTWVRSDLLESFGMNSPVTVAEYEEYLNRCVNAGLKSPIGANIFSWIGTANYAYDLPGMTNLSGEFDFTYSLYHDGNTVHSSLEENSSLQEYVTLMHDWYEKGYFYSDIISMGNGSEARGQSDDLIYGGDVGVIAGGLETCNEFYSRRTDESMSIAPSHTMILEEGQTIHYGKNELTTSGTGSAVITSSCEDIEAACRFMDWFYTDMGIETMNYGPEGLTWNWSADGTTREFTAATYADVLYDLDPSSLLMVYTASSVWVTINDPYNALYYQSNDLAMDALEIWTEDIDSEMYLTSRLSLTTDESEFVNGIVADINTTMGEYLSKFLVGDLDIGAEWDTFISNVYDLGLQDVIDTYQGAYDRYLQR